MGIGLALVHMGQSNTGGISLLGLIMQKCNPQFQVGAWISGLKYCGWYLPLQWYIVILKAYYMRL